MDFSQKEIDELKAIVPSVSRATDGGYDYFLLEGLVLPDGCEPMVLDALLCPNARDGYSSRLYFAARVKSNVQRNWNGSLHVFDRNWYAISWQSQPGLKLAEMLMVHLKALR
ncbi:MAG: hypothetical protein JST32_05430 [Bacteroidetes bacterium]|nr:hypothetical protein [Bacteroidota bacterium]